MHLTKGLLTCFLPIALTLILVTVGKVGSLRSDRMKPFIHSRPMGSLDNSFEEQDLKKFILKIKTDIEKSQELQLQLQLAVSSVTQQIYSNSDSVSASAIHSTSDDDDGIDSTSVPLSHSASASDSQPRFAKDVESYSENILDEEVDLRNVSFVVEPKIDGLSMCIRYDINGILLGAGTRGDGAEGEDVTANIQVR